VRTLLLLLFFVNGCAHKPSPKVSDTFFREDQRDWLEIYAEELRSALANGDNDAFYFFWPEYLKELEKTRQSPIIIRVINDR
tara:strand:+ start:378 stop:623 length:246 start_codon:yes stop_codon:yes gene_type:complete